MTHVYCQECGFQNPETSNYCARCGALLEKREPPAAETTQALSPEDVVDLGQSAVEALEGPALVVRSGGGRAGETFRPRPGRTRIGRSPDADVFLDDVTVSRDHAVLVHRSGAWYLDDSGSLNGTYVNRGRIDSHRLEDGDELQIGKYKLTYLAR